MEPNGVLPLSGKVILITRASHQSSGIEELVRGAGGTPLLFPTIEIVPSGSQESHVNLDRAIDALYIYDGLIFTSSNGVEFFIRRFREKVGDDVQLKSKLVYVVGAKSAEAVRAHGMDVTLMPDMFTSAELAKIIDHKDLAGKSFLFPRGNLGAELLKDILQDTLKLLGATVDAVTVYETRKPKDEVLRPASEALLAGKVDVITFTSPSTFQNFIDCFRPEELGPIFERGRIAVIGPVTAKAVRDAGFEPDCVSGASTVESLVETIIATL